MFTSCQPCAAYHWLSTRVPTGSLDETTVPPALTLMPALALARRMDDRRSSGVGEGRVKGAIGKVVVESVGATPAAVDQLVGDDDIPDGESAVEGAGGEASG